MNYYNPYFLTYPYQTAAAAPGLLSRLTAGRGLTLSSILSGTGRTLNTINQAIPVIRQARPLWNNAKTMFRLMNEFKKVDTPTSPKQTIPSSPKKEESTSFVDYSKGPTFFL